MRVLAVIPARAGSKGIPNKNIRIVGDHPLIYYAIKNAIDSKMITDIVVTTDSVEVGIIARQMGVNTKWREARLCGDDVTLDEVIYDAIPRNEMWDYIVTMQVTSPTLTVTTLDRAITYAIDNDLDTVISVINKPHLAWIDEGGKKTPAYKKRLNRQLLPPYFIETGAFVISRESVVSADSRIGKKIDVFEISEEESQDIDTFADLLSVSSLVKHEKVGIYVNGNNSRGVGHVYRALELADEFYVKPDIYYDKNQTDCKIFGNTSHTLIPVNGISELFEHCSKGKYTLFINDILSTTIDYMIALKSSLGDAKIINFEDDGEGTQKADLVINALYGQDEQPNFRVGEKYYIAGRLFLFYKPIQIRAHVKRVFICFGGADPQNYSDRILRIIDNEEYRDYSFTVVLGRAKSNVDELMNKSKNNIEVLYDVKNMPELMSECDIGITSRGRTGYELAMLGVPLFVIAQNQREEKHGFLCDENGFTYIGLNPPDEIIKSTLDMYLKLSQKTRQHFQEKLLTHDLRGGRKRVMALIRGL